jgi:DNA-binding transcriptional regulator YdaS (Cro superfamily)
LPEREQPRTTDPGKQAAVSAAGGVRALARLLGISHVAVVKWERIPIGRVEAIERITNIDRRVLRPDIYLRRRASI